MLSGDLDLDAHVTQDEPFEVKLKLGNKTFLVALAVVAAWLVTKVK